MSFTLLFIGNTLVYFIFDAIIGYDFIILSCYSIFVLKGKKTLWLQKKLQGV